MGVKWGQVCGLNPVKIVTPVLWDAAEGLQCIAETGAQVSMLTDGEVSWRERRAA